MIGTLILAPAATLAAAMLLTTPGDTVTWTGWFSDKGCAEAKVRSGNVSPNGTDCVTRCLSEGATAVFLSEQTKAMYEVKDHARVIEDVGYHVELTGVVDEEAKTVSVRSVKRLAQVAQTCARPKKKKSD